MQYTCPSCNAKSNAYDQHTQILQNELSWERDVVQKDLEDKINRCLHVIGSLIEESKKLPVQSNDWFHEIANAETFLSVDMQGYFKPYPKQDSEDELPF